MTTDFEIDKLRNIILQFKLPMAFDVLNCLKQGDQGAPFLVVLNDIPAKINIERIYEFRYGNEGFQLAEFSKMEEDRNGILSHSNVQVWFDAQTFDSDKIDKDVIRLLPEQFIDLSIDYLNKFIKTYRLVTSEYWLRPLIRKDIFNFQYILVDTDNNKEVIHQMIAGHHKVEFNGGKEFQLHDEAENLLRNILMSDIYDFGEEFRLNLNDNLSLGYYNVALVQSVTLFEYFIYFNLKQKLSRTKLDKIKKKEACGCMSGISEVCERGFLEHFGVDFGSTDEFKALKDDALKYRNLIVHGELIESVDKETCEKAVTSVINAQEYLIENVFNEVESG